MGRVTRWKWGHCITCVCYNKDKTPRMDCGEFDDAPNGKIKDTFGIINDPRTSYCLGYINRYTGYAPHSGTYATKEELEELKY